jgi:hypothetical protein
VPSATPPAAFADQIAAADAAIEAARAAAAALAEDRKVEQAALNAALANGNDKDAHAAQRRARQIDEAIAFEEVRVAALQGRRAELVEAERVAGMDAKWSEVEALIAPRAAAAQKAADAIKALGEAVTELDRLTRRLAATVPDPTVKPIAEDEIRFGVDYSLMGAGIRWPYADTASARIEGNGIADRVARSNAAAAFAVATARGAA